MASGSTSSISMAKTATANNSAASRRRRSCDTTCSSNSSCFLQKKKPVNPLATSVRTVRTHTHSSGNVVRQRVMSAKLIKLRNLQSQLNDANFHLVELSKENRALKTLQKRQDKALNNYEGVNADLPRLIKSHEEENRTLAEKNRALKKALREANEQLKIKDEELNVARDQLKHLSALSKDKHLAEREKLKELVDESKLQIKNYENEISMLNRKLALEVKNTKYKLSAEITKHKRCQRELGQALLEIERLSSDIVKERNPPLRKQRFANTSKRQSTSLINTNSNEQSEEISDLNLHSDSSSEIKLEPISSRSESKETLQTNHILQSPSEKIKARLSAKILTPPQTINSTEISEIMDKLTIEEENIKKNFSSVRSPKLKSLNLTNGNEKNGDTLENSSLEDGEEEAETKVEEKNIKPIISPHVEKKNEEVKLDIILKEDDFDLVNKIWSEEYAFKKNYGTRDRNGNITKSDPKVPIENKRKLLAALRDIDNGKSIEENNEIIIDQNDEGDKKSKLMKELFG